MAFEEEDDLALGQVDPVALERNRLGLEGRPRLDQAPSLLAGTRLDRDDDDQARGTRRRLRRELGQQVSELEDDSEAADRADDDWRADPPVEDDRRVAVDPI